MMRQPRRLLTTLATLSPLWTGRVIASSSTAASLSTAAGFAVGKHCSSSPPRRLSLFVSSPQSRALSVRGGGDADASPAAHPAPGSPFHYAFPVHDLEAAKDFYGRILGCQEGRASTKWQDYSLHGHQIVCHWVGKDYRCVDYYNPVDGDEVPVPHAGLALTVDEFHALAARVAGAGVEFLIEPHLRFAGMPGEQYTMFFKDCSGNNLEFKAMTKPENLFARYNVADK